MVRAEIVIVAGIGFRSAARSADITGIVARARALSGHAVDLLAVPEFKQRYPALLEALSDLGLPLVAIAPWRLERAQTRCPTRSAAAMAAVGLGSVAEACALAALDEDGKLVLPRIAGAQATCALAMGYSS
jgi:cobalamin biosynthesis protein CbiG